MSMMMIMTMIDDSALQFCRHSDYWKLLGFFSDKWEETVWTKWN